MDTKINKKDIVDLHCHTTASDGALRPNELIDRAISNQVNLLAITDHDVIDGFLEAQRYLDTLNDHDMRLISGIEISTVWENQGIHIVGLNFDPNNQALTDLVVMQKEKRIERAKLMAQRLGKAIKVDDLFLQLTHKHGTPLLGRAHFAKWLVENGHAKTFQGVFKQFLVKNKPGYVPNNWCSMQEAIEVIHQAGGLAVLAHPGKYKLSAKWLKRLLTDFKALLGDGMEVASGQQDIFHRQQLGNHANNYGLKASQGSDFHYPDGYVELGRNLWIPENNQPIWNTWL